MFIDEQCIYLHYCSFKWYDLSLCSYDTNALAIQIVEACFASGHIFYISSESEEKYAPIKHHLKVKNSPK